MTFSQIERLIERYDAATSTLDTAVTDRISASMDAAFRQMIRELERQYPTWQGQGSLFASQRRLLLLQELGPLLSIVRPEEAAAYEALMAEALQLSHTTGATLADELVRVRDPGYPLQDFATIPIEAAVLQARDGVQRLRRYDEEFRAAASSIVEQGLIQGWGTKRVQGVLERELGVAKGKAETLARTEVMSALNDASQQRYAANDLLVQVFNSPSERTCPFCLARHGNVYRVGQVSVPFHPRCRDYLAPFSPKWQERGLTDDAAITADKAARIADFEAKGGRLSPGPTYWERKAGLTAAPAPVWRPGDALVAVPAAARAVTPPPQPVAPPKANQAYFDKWADSYKDAPPLFRRVLDKFDYPSEIPPNAKQGAFHRRGQIHMGALTPGQGRADSVWRHEYGHYIDRLVGAEKGGAGSPIGYISSSPEGSKAMVADMRSLNRAKKDAQSMDYGVRRELEAKARFAAYVEENYKKLLNDAPTVFRQIDTALDAKNSDFNRELIAAAILTKDIERFIPLAERALATRYQGKEVVIAADLAGAITRNNIGYGHTKAYYKETGKRETEAYANVFSMLSSGGELELEVARYIAPAFTRFVEDTLEAL